MAEKFMLLVEDNSDDEVLTLHALQENNIVNKVVVARDGAEALDYLFGTGPHGGRDLSEMPTVTLLDLKLPKIDGLEVLRRLRANDRTRLLPVVILTTSQEDEDLIASAQIGCGFPYFWAEDDARLRRSLVTLLRGNSAVGQWRFHPAHRL